MTVTETGQQSCSAIFPSTIWSTVISTAQISCASSTNILTTVLPCSSPYHATVTVTAPGNCTRSGAMVTVTSTEQATQTRTVYSTIVSTSQPSCASPKNILSTTTYILSQSPSQETMTVTVSGSCTQAGPIIPSTTIIVTSMERASCSVASAQTNTVYSTVISTAQANCGSQVYTQSVWATKTETQSGPAVYPTPSTVTVTTTVTTSEESQTSKGGRWASSVGSQTAPQVYGSMSASAGGASETWMGGEQSFTTRQG
jgi:hypothetical protein